MSDFASKYLNINSLKKWDTAFVAEKLKQATLDLNEQELKPYFPLQKVLNGLFKIVQKLYCGCIRFLPLEFYCSSICGKKISFLRSNSI